MSPTLTLVGENFVDLTLSVHLKDGLLESLLFSEIFQVAGMFSPQLTNLMDRFITGKGHDAIGQMPGTVHGKHFRRAARWHEQRAEHSS
jgi:hypothetical protein